MSDEVKISIGIPTYDYVPAECFNIVVNMMQDAERRVRGLILRRGHPVAKVRNEIVEAFLETSCTHLFFIDNDTIPPPDAVDKLLECDWPMAAGIYLILKEKAVVPAIMTEFGDPQGWLKEWSHYTEPFEAAFAATGCVMYRREVFEKIPFPWFDYDEGCYGVTEDFWFARKASEYGYTYKVHPKLYAEHYKTVPIGKFIHGCKRANRATDELQHELDIAGI